jgi:hypothetical protein
MAFFTTTTMTSTSTSDTSGAPSPASSTGSLGISSLSVDASSSSSGDRDNCSICQHVLSSNESISNSLTENSAVCPQLTLRCGHVFHRDCFKPLLDGSTRVLCPNCRTVIREGPPPRASTPDTSLDPDPSLDSSSSGITWSSSQYRARQRRAATQTRLLHAELARQRDIQRELDNMSTGSSQARDALGIRLRRSRDDTSSSSGASQAEQVWQSVGQGRRRGTSTSSSSSSSRPVDEVSLMDESVLDVDYIQSASADVAQIDSLLRRLHRRAFLILDARHIASRATSRTTLPKTIRRLRRQIQMYTKKLRDLQTHAPLDDEWTELMNQRRAAQRLTAHDADPNPWAGESDTDDETFDSPPTSDL